MSDTDRHRRLLARQGIVVSDLGADGPGIRISVPAGVEADLPVEVFLGSAAVDMPGRHRTLIVAGEGSVVHCLQGCVAPIYTPTVERSEMVDIQVGADARVQHTSMQNWTPNVSLVSERRATVEAGGRIDWIDVAIGCGRTRTEVVTDLIGDGAEAELTSAVLATGDQHHEISVSTTHQASDTVASTRLLAVAAGSGRITTGLTDVDRGAGASRTDVERRGLVVGPAAGIVADPHDGPADLSAVDPEQVFHLMSRGMTESQAIQVIVAGFTDPIIRALPLEYGVEWSRVIEAWATTRHIRVT